MRARSQGQMSGRGLLNCLIYYNTYDFSSRWNVENMMKQLSLDEDILEQVLEFNFLCLTIDQHLTWNGHMQKISRYQNHLGLRANCNFFIPKIQKRLYNTLTLLHLHYCRFSQSEIIGIITFNKYDTIRNHHEKHLICSILKISRKQRHQNCTIDTNKMNSQNRFIQFSQIPMMIIHTILY